MSWQAVICEKQVQETKEDKDGDKKMLEQKLAICQVYHAILLLKRGHRVYIDLVRVPK